MPLEILADMEDPEDISVLDVYEIVTDFAKEFRPVLGIYGPEPLNNIMSKVLTTLEHLEAQTVKIGQLNTLLQERESTIMKLERDKVEKAADRQRFEKELEQIEEHWREELGGMVAVINRLQEENRKLVKSLAAKQENSSENHAHPMSPEVDVGVLQQSRASIDKLRDQIKAKDRELYSKSSEIDKLTDQVNRLSLLVKDLRKKHRVCLGQVRSLIDERADYIAQLQDLQHKLGSLRQQLGIAEKENEDLAQSHSERPDLTNKAIYDLDDPNRPRFTTDELKEILRERNEFKARVSDLEEELALYRPKNEQSSLDEDEDEDAPVQGPIPFEPNDAPWKRSESGIRKLFRKLFSETNVTFLGSSPKRSLSSLSKMALASGATLDSPL